ncbi:putative nuclease HARBI1 [Prorops nasuta]|uniref:putative nuclease HARBI1 n=1 Tax=Prorops nasuta TaxID=863751 RepID=UPI0034CD235C
MNLDGELNLDIFDESNSSSSEDNGNEEIVRHKRYVRDFFNPLEFYEEYQFLIRYRFSKQSVMYGLLPLIQDYLMKNDQRGLPISPIIQLLISLRYYPTNSYQRVSADLSGIARSTVSTIIFRVSTLLASYVHKYIKYPKNEALEKNKILFKQLGYGQGAIGLPNICGAIDCTHIRLSHVRLYSQGEVYRNRKSYFSLNVQAIVGPNMEFLDLVPEWPGSQHDSIIFQNSRSFVRFQQQKVSGMLVGDKGYPALTFLLTPFRNPVSLEEERYNEIHSRTRMVVERTFGVWKRRFPCLSNGLTLKLQTCTSIITATAVLHNLLLMYNEILPEAEDGEIVTSSLTENENYIENDVEPGNGFLTRQYIVRDLFQ